MKLLWLSHFVPYPATGHGALQRGHHLLKEASKRHEVHLVALSPPTALPRPGDIERAVAELSSFVASVEAFPLPRDQHGVRRALSACHAVVRRVSYWERWYRSRAMLEHLRRLGRSVRFDLVHLDIVFLSRYLEALPGVPVVLNHHNIESHLLWRRAAAQRTRLGRVFFEREARKTSALERTFVPWVARNVVVSDLDGERLRELTSGARITTVANGVDVEFFRARHAVDGNGKSMTFAGGMDWFPNRDAITYFVTEVWPALVQEDPERTMTVIGRNPPPAVLAAARDPRLRVLGFVDDVRPHIEAAAVYVCPMRVGGGTRLKILDALAMSRPIVSTDLGVEGLGLTEGEHYLRAQTPREFVTQVRRLETDPALRRRLGEAGRALVVQQYSWPRIAESLEQAYSEELRTTLAGVSSAPSPFSDALRGEAEDVAIRTDRCEVIESPQAGSSRAIGEISQVVDRLP
jgi:polysaccharide biosynthesis protein PslH